MEMKNYSYDIIDGKMLVIREKYTLPVRHRLLVTDSDNIVKLLEKGISEKALEDLGYNDKWENIQEADTGWNPGLTDKDNYDKV
jgi:hypothetical protein